MMKVAHKNNTSKISVNVEIPLKEYPSDVPKVKALVIQTTECILMMQGYFAVMNYVLDLHSERQANDECLPEDVYEGFSYMTKLGVALASSSYSYIVQLEEFVE